MSSHVVADIPRSSTEDVRVSLSHFKGHDLVDLRVFVEAAGNDDRVPTRRGIALRIDRLPELVIALQEVEAIARRNGLLEDDLDDGEVE